MTEQKIYGQDLKYREKFDIVTSRAVSNLNVLTEYMLPLIKIGGKAICMKGPNYLDELEKSKKAIEILGGRIESIKKVIVGEDERNIIIIKKENVTVKKYPRKAGIPIKNPIE